MRTLICMSGSFRNSWGHVFSMCRLCRGQLRRLIAVFLVLQWLIESTVRSINALRWVLRCVLYTVNGCSETGCLVQARSTLLTVFQMWTCPKHTGDVLTTMNILNSSSYCSVFNYIFVISCIEKSCELTQFLWLMKRWIFCVCRQHRLKICINRFERCQTFQVFRN